MDTSGLISIKKIVDGFILKTRINYEYATLFELACDSIRELNVWLLSDSKQVVKLTMNSNYVVDLPSDFLTFVMLAVPINGRYYTLTRDNGMITTTTEDSGAEILDPDYGEGVGIDMGGSWPNYASTLKNLEGYYNIDYKARRIVFRNVSRSEVFLVYKSSGLNTTEQTLVPVIAKRAIEDYMEWMIKSYRKREMNIPEVEIERLKRRYENEYDKVKGLQVPGILDFEDAFRKVINQTIRA